MSKNLQQELLAWGLVSAAIIIAGWSLRGLLRGDWSDEYYALKKLRSYYGDYSYLDQF